jgi:hypothetical protein
MTHCDRIHSTCENSIGRYIMHEDAYFRDVVGPTQERVQEDLEVACHNSGANSTVIDDLEG